MATRWQQSLPLVLSLLTAAVMVMMLMGTACTPNPEEDSMPTPPEPDLVERALRYGDLDLPPSAQVLGVERQRGIDLIYVLAISVDPDEFDTHLAESNFTAELTVTRDPSTWVPVAGFDLSTATDAVTAHDRVPPVDGMRNHSVSRKIIVDRSDPGKLIVHWWLMSM